MKKNHLNKLGLLLVFLISSPLIMWSNTSTSSLSISALPSFANLVTTPPLPSSANLETDSSPCPLWQAKCSGHRKYKDDSEYRGEFRFGKAHGKGTMTWPDGSQYKGEFRNGLQHGWGEFTFENGNHYEGDWQDGYMEGQGAYTWSCGQEYIGTFKEDKMHGQGSILMGNGESYSGTWKNGMTDGEGVYTRMDGSQFIGNTQEGLRQGSGMLVWETGDTLKGNWVAGKLDGNTLYIFSNGDQMSTIWDDGEMLEEMAYQTFDGIETSGTITEIEDELILQDLDKMPDFEENMQLGLYSFGLEYKNMNRFDEATGFLKRSQEYTPISSRFNTIIAMQLSEVKERRGSGGWARLD